MEFAVFDAIGIIILIVAAIRGAFRGFVTELMSTLSILAGVLVAIIFTAPTAPLLVPYIGNTFWTPIVAFLLLFVVTYLLVKLLEALLHGLVERIEIEKLDQALGFFLGIVEGLLLLAVLVFLLRIQPFLEIRGLFEGSFLADLMQRVIPIGAQFIEERLQNYRV
jgi:membrane protein required for colicin V production